MSMKSKRRTVNRLFAIPMYDCKLRVVVCENIRKERQKPKYDLFGKVELDGEYDGLCTWSGGHNFAIFLCATAAKDIAIISHEVFHLTHRILEWSSSNFDKDHHEQGALLHGYLMELVMNAIRKR